MKNIYGLKDHDCCPTPGGHCYIGPNDACPELCVHEFEYFANPAGTEAFEKCARCGKQQPMQFRVQCGPEEKAK